MCADTSASLLCAGTLLLSLAYSSSASCSCDASCSASSFAVPFSRGRVLDFHDFHGFVTAFAVHMDLEGDLLSRVRCGKPQLVLVYKQVPFEIIRTCDEAPVVLPASNLSLHPDACHLAVVLPRTVVGSMIRFRTPWLLCRQG